MPLLFLTKNDTKLLKGLLEREKRHPPQPRDYPVNGVPQAPEVYLAKPKDTISALQTSEEYGGGYDVPGSGECDLYKLVWVTDHYTVRGLTGFTGIVYNYTANELTSDNYVLAVRDVLGNFFAIPGASAEIWFQFELITDLHAGDSASAYVLDENQDRTETTITVHSSAAQHTGYGSAETGDGSGNGGITRYWGNPYNNFQTHAISCDPLDRDGT